MKLLGDRERYFTICPREVTGVLANSLLGRPTRKSHEGVRRTERVCKIRNEIVLTNQILRTLAQKKTQKSVNIVKLIKVVMSS